MDIYNNFPLSEILYYKIGGKAKFLLKVQNKKDLISALEFIKKNKIKKTLVIGFGSNLLVSDDFFDGAVIWFANGKSSININNGLVEVFAGETLDNLIQFCFKNNLKGPEWAGGLPSTIGGAVRGNAGAFGFEIKDLVYKVEAFEILKDGNFTAKELTNKDLNFSYRTSLIKENKNLIVANVFFKLLKTYKNGIEEAKKIYYKNINYRKKHHPTEYPSCGSVFKNITEENKVNIVMSKWLDIKKLVEEKWHGKVAMGYIISKLNFQGFKIGGAKVSEKHANYIVNFDNAKFNDIYSIIEKIKEKFFQTFEFYPELEVEVVK